MEPQESRFAAVTRRAFLRRAAGTGVVIALPSALLTGCGDGDAAALGEGQVVGATVAATVTPTATPAATDPATDPGTATAIPVGSEAVVAFTYAAAASGQGPVRNPYVAVWVEDAAGELVATVALWFLQESKGTRWLSDLRRWYSVDGGQDTIEAVSSATRTPGDHQVVWDGSTSDGAQAPQGDLYVCIEAAREHGPYSLIREAVSLGTDPVTVDLADVEELQDASLTYIPA